MTPTNDRFLAAALAESGMPISAGEAGLVTEGEELDDAMREADERFRRAALAENGMPISAGWVPAEAEGMLAPDPASLALGVVVRHLLDRRTASPDDLRELARRLNEGGVPSQVSPTEPDSLQILGPEGQATTVRIQDEAVRLVAPSGRAVTVRVEEAA